MPADVDSAEAVGLKAKVDDQGNIVRDLKTSGAEKADLDSAVQLLLQLKSEYKELTGVDLSGGGGKKAKKDKKAAAKGDPAVKQPPAEKKAKVDNKPVEKVVAKRGGGTPQATQKPPASVTTSTADRDMSMAAVLGRLANRATKADTIVAQLKAQLTAVRQTAALSACKVEEQRLTTENEALKHEVRQLKERLVQAENQNGVPQVNIRKCGTVSSAPAPKPTPAVAKQPAKLVVKEKQAGNEAKPKKQEKKENKPKAAAGGSAEGENKVDISRIDMRIGKIVNVQKHPEADSLYLEEVDVGEEKNRTILSGLVKHVPENQMKDRIAIFMCNLKPAKMRGIFSEGMIMCGSTPEKVEIIEPPSGVSVGDKVYVEGYEGTPDTQLNPKKKIFEQVQPDLRISPEGVAIYKGVAWKVKGTDGLCTVPTMRDTPIK